MADFNRVILMGRLTRDPQLKFTPQNLAVCEFGLATGRKFRTASGEEREETCYVDCTLFGKGGEVFQKYMNKGKPCHIEGRLKFDTWEDKNGGGKRTKLSVVVDNFQFLSDGTRGQGQQGSAPAEGEFDGAPAPRSGGYSSGGGGGGGGAGGGASGGGYSSGNAAPASRSNAQSNTPSRPAPANPPYDESAQFKEDDIPF